MRARRVTGLLAAGFTLIEVMVALIIISVGLLGIAKMQALALSSTGTSRLRSLAALQGASLASTMHANRAYWASATLTSPIEITGTTVTTSDTTLRAELSKVSSNGYCTVGHGAPCAAATLAATDLKEWATELKNLLPSSAATISCPAVGTHLTCTVEIRWQESAVAINSQSTAAAADSNFQVPTYRLYVEP